MPQPWLHDLLIVLGKVIFKGHSSSTETDDRFFFKLFELTILVVTISISRKKKCLPWFPGGHFLRGLIVSFRKKLKHFFYLSILESLTRFLAGLNSVYCLIVINI